jgi:hypothetical protein
MDGMKNEREREAANQPVKLWDPPPFRDAFPLALFSFFLLLPFFPSLPYQDGRSSSPWCEGGEGGAGHQIR